MAVASFIASLMLLLFSRIVDLLECRDVLLRCHVFRLYIAYCFVSIVSCTRYPLYEHVFSTCFAFCLFLCCFLYLFKGVPGTLYILFPTQELVCHVYIFVFMSLN